MNFEKWYKLNLLTIVGNIYCFIIMIIAFMAIGYLFINVYGTEHVIFVLFTTFFPLYLLFLLRIAYKKIYTQK